MIVLILYTYLVSKLILYHSYLIVLVLEMAILFRPQITDDTERYYYWHLMNDYDGYILLIVQSGLTCYKR